MTRFQFSRPGEAPASIRRVGVQPATREDEPIPDGARLVVDCPSCRRPVPHPGHTRDGYPTLAECADPRCDLYFEFDPARVYLL